MGAKLYVGNLPFGITDDQLSEHFAQAGAITSTAVISDRATGRSRGFGFVEFGSDEDAQKAIEMFHGQDFQGRNLVVNEARERQERTGGGSGGFRPRDGGFRRNDN